MIGKVFNRYTVLGNVNNRVLLLTIQKQLSRGLYGGLIVTVTRTAEVTSLTVHQLLKSLLQGLFK
mgnify:CR=1 FL=1